ncbi:hypothetical protein SFRURICE_006712 [Spodoptera frugiperda]|nr:hypothetical protein SFRURICE_006712 [Spodoptera frugiperda]
MAENGDVYKKSFNGTCTLGVNKRTTGSIAKKAEAYLNAVKESLGTAPVAKVQQRPSIPKLEVVQRVAAIPIVGSGIEVTEKVYYKIRESNPLIRWYLSLGEKSLATGVQLALPAVLLFETPIHQLDKFLCKSLDVVEKTVPSINLPPQAMYSETRRFVVRRADSVKQLGTAVLDSRVTAVTATALDRALTTADNVLTIVVIIVTSADEVDGGDSGRARAAQAVQHGARLGRKLQRRLTRQALAEAKAIKEQIHVLVYVAELTMPVETALSEVKEWRSKLETLLQHLQSASKTYLEHLAIFLAGNEEREKIAPRSTYEQRDALAALNGLN